MNIAVCIAPVTDPGSVRYDIETGTIRGGTIQGNGLDWTALSGAEAYLRKAKPMLDRAEPTELIAVSVGGADADAVLRDALVRGADRAVRVVISGDPYDPLGIASALAHVAASLDCVLVMCGARSADFGGEFIGAAIATELDRPSASRIIALEPADPGRLRVAWKVEGGRREIYALPLPAVVTVEDELAEPDYVPVMSRRHREGLNKTIEVIHVDTVDDRPRPDGHAGTLVQAKPRTKHAAAPTSYIGEVSADLASAPAALAFTEETAARFLAQLGQWTDDQRGN